MYKEKYFQQWESLRKTIDFILENRDYFTICLGNHEVFSYKYLKGEIKGIDKEMQEKYFLTGLLLEEDEEYKVKFFQLVELSKPFLIHPDFVCSHSPCKVKYLGKLDKYSLKAQLKHRYPYTNDYATEEEYKVALEDNLSFMKEQAVANFPFIFSGHIPVKEPVKLGSQVMLDTGAVYGNKLTAATVKEKRLVLNQVEGDPFRETKYLISLFDKKEEVNLNELDSREKKRIQRMLGVKPVSYITPTMSPADRLDNELESIEAALNYYKNKGVNEIVIQPKAMGSNVTMTIRKVPKK